MTNEKALEILAKVGGFGSLHFVVDTRSGRNKMVFLIGTDSTVRLATGIEALRKEIEDLRERLALNELPL